jgi:lipoprotein-anchoring transpeptidase ErfK/SrfK
MRSRFLESSFRASARARTVLLAACLFAGCASAAQQQERRAEAPPPEPAVATPHDSTHVVIRLKERRLELVTEHPAFSRESFPIAVGRKGHETPTGRFQVEEMVVGPEYLKIDPTDRTRVLKRFPPGPNNPLGERWIGFAHGDGWTVGMHGTPNPELLGQAVSGGCIRMRNADVIRVYDRVRLGTPVIVHP